MQKLDQACHLSPQDNAVDNVQQPTLMKIRIKGSKTDQTRIGVDLYVGKMDNAIVGILSLEGTQTDGPLFILEDGCPLTRELLVQKLRATLSQAGIDCTRISGHSFRIGAATTAMVRGVSETTV